MTARKHFAKFGEKEINTVQRTVFISSATGSGHVITCTTRRWVVSGQLYCFQLPPAKGRREACKPFTDPTSRITNVRINRAAAHRSNLFFGIFSALPASSRLDVQKVRLRRLAIGRTKNLAEKGGRVLSRPACVKPPRRTESTPSPSCHRQDEKSCRKREGAFPPCLRRGGFRACGRGSLLAAAPKVTKRSA